MFRVGVSRSWVSRFRVRSFRVSRFGFRVSWFAVTGKGFMFRVGFSGSGFRDSGFFGRDFMFHVGVSNLGFRV